MIKYTQDDLETFEDLHQSLGALTRMSRAMPSVMEACCRQMDEFIRDVYAIRMNRIVAMAVEEDKRPPLKEPVTLASLKEGLEHYVAEDGQDRMRPKQ